MSGFKAFIVEAFKQSLVGVAAQDSGAWRLAPESDLSAMLDCFEAAGQTLKLAFVLSDSDERSYVSIANGVLVEMQGASSELSHDVAVHIAFARPKFLTRDEVPAEVVAAPKKKARGRLAQLEKLVAAKETEVKELKDLKLSAQLLRKLKEDDQDQKEEENDGQNETREHSQKTRSNKQLQRQDEEWKKVPPKENEPPQKEEGK